MNKHILMRTSFIFASHIIRTAFFIFTNLFSIRIWRCYLDFNICFSIQAISISHFTEPLGNSTAQL